MEESAVKSETSPPQVPDEPEVEEDADIDMNINPAATEKPAVDTEIDDEAIAEPKEPTKKDVSLCEFLAKMDDYAPIVSLYYLSLL